MRPNGATTTRTRRRTQARLRSQRTDRERAAPWADAGAQAAADEAAMGSGPGEPASGSAAYSTSFRIFCTELSCSRS